MDETLTTYAYNDKVTVDISTTGDISNLCLWIGLMVLGATGIGTTLLTNRKNLADNEMAVWRMDRNPTYSFCHSNRNNQVILVSLYKKHPIFKDDSLLVYGIVTVQPKS